MPEAKHIIAGRYRIGRQIGAGGMGAVFQAEHSETGSFVALKLIRGDADPERVARFQREIRALGALQTKHVARALDAGVDDAGAPWLAMELLDGEDLAKVLRRLGPQSPDVALRIVAQACLGLEKAHEAGVIHRDIKPANIFIANEDQNECIVKLLDFGIAKIKPDALGKMASAPLTQTTSLMGSPHYMSPEQARGSKNVDGRTDVWSLGVVLYELVSGRTPWADVETLGELIIALVSRPAAPVSAIAPHVSPEVEAIIARALAVEQSERFAGPRDLLDAIKAVLGTGLQLERSMLVRRPGTTFAPRYEATLDPSSAEAARAVAYDDSHVSPHVHPTPSVARPSRAWIAWLAASLLAVVGLFGVATRGPRADPPVLASAPPPSNVVVPALAPPAAVASEQPRLEVASAVVFVRITPPMALVELDGAPLNLDRGALRVEGRLGSVHRVRARSMERVVVITEGGAEPAELDFSSRTVSAQASRPPATPASAAPVASANPARRPATPLVRDTSEFGE